MSDPLAFPGALPLVNAALRLLGEAGLTSFGEGSELAESCNQIYSPTVLALQASYPWRHTLSKRRLSRLAEPPLNEWNCAHALPSDCMVLRALFPSARARVTIDSYELFDGRVFSDAIDLWADIQRDTDPASWPPGFHKLAVHALASDLAVAVTGSTSLADYHRRIAFGTPTEAGDGGLVRQVRRMDAQQQPPQQVTDWPLLAARLGGRSRNRGGSAAVPASSDAGPWDEGVWEP